MSLLSELAKENMLYMALHGVRVVLERELDIKSVIFSLSETTKQEMVRRAREKQKMEFPYSYFLLQALSGMKDQQNNYAVRKHGVRLPSVDRATSKKGYLFPITLGLEFHYVDSDQKRLLNMAQSLVILSVTDGLTFQIDVGDMFTFAVRMEIPTDATVNIQEEQSPQTPGASDVNVQFVMHAQIGFFRDVSAVNGRGPLMSITINDEQPFEVELPHEHTETSSL